MADHFDVAGVFIGARNDQSCPVCRRVAFDGAPADNAELACRVCCAPLVIAADSANRCARLLGDSGDEILERWAHTVWAEKERCLRELEHMRASRWRIADAKHVELWDAIMAFADSGRISSARMVAVARVERAVAALAGEPLAFEAHAELAAEGRNG